MIIIESINPAEQHFMLVADEPVRCEISLAGGTIQACAYEGCTTDVDQEPAVVYDGSISPPAKTSTVSDSYPAARRREVIRAALQFLHDEFDRAYNLYYDRNKKDSNGRYGVWTNHFYGTMDQLTPHEVQEMLDGDL